MVWPSDVVSPALLVSCDWFAVSCLLDAPRGERFLSVPDGWSVVQMSATAVWADRFFILNYDGNKIATVLCSPRTPAIDARRCLVEIANRWLYYDEFHAVCDAVLSCLPMAITGINRVDLCCDFQMDARLWRAVSALAEGSAYVKALKAGAVWWQMVQMPFAGSDMCRVPHCLTFGGKESIFKWKIYWKWLELQQADADAKKPYISDLWKKAGMDARCVWRLEVSVSGSNRLVGADAKKVAPFAWFDDKVRIFADLYYDKFVIRRDEGHKDKRNDKRVPFLDIEGMKSLWHAEPQSERGDVDCERRLVCRLWKECSAIDVQANRPVFDMLRGNLCQLLERPANMNALSAICGVSMDDVNALFAK